jgi:predicted HTH transcriptional regulator
MNQFAHKTGIERFNQPESIKLEFKQAFPKNATNVLKTIVAFANGTGGEMIIGVTDDRKIIGVEDPLLIEEKLANMVHDSIYPLLSPFISTLCVDDKVVLIVQILPGTQKPYYIKYLGLEKGVFIRIGSTNRHAKTEIVELLQQESIGISYDFKMDSSKNINCLDQKSLDIFFKRMGHSKYTNEALTKWHILKKNNGDFFPSVMGIILFGKQEMIMDYDFAGIRLTKYNGTGLSNISETKEYTLPISMKIEKICKDISYFLQKESYLDGAKRIERTIIPEFAIREAVVNAIAHRDYRIKGSSIKINVFDDRMEVISPGILPGNLDISDVGTGLSECRNRSIVRILRRLEVMEELGTGVARIFVLFQEKKLKKPSLMEQNQFFKLILPQVREYEERTDRIYDLIKSSQGLKASELAQLLNAHRNTILQDINKLIQLNKIEKIGSGKNIKYKTVD